MIIEKTVHRPFKWMVIDDRQALMDFFNRSNGGYGQLLIAYLKNNYGLTEDIDYTFADHRKPGGCWVGTFYAFRKKEHAELFDLEFGK